LEVQYKIIKTFNHNVVFCIDEELSKECILIGRGIGFGKKENEVIDNKKIEKRFHISNEANKDKFKGLTKIIDNDIVGVTEEVIALIHNLSSGKLDEKIHITLLDHVSFAIERHRNGINIVNPFIVEEKTLYPEEYELASKALNIINSRINIDLPQDEIGFIALHIHAAFTHGNISRTSLNTTIINEMVKFIEETFEINISADSINYSRLVIHLRFALDRAEKQIPIENLLLSSIKRKFKMSYNASKKLADKIKLDYNIKFTEDEIGYLAIHLEKIRMNN
jgi:transcriptional antiterminator